MSPMLMPDTVWRRGKREISGEGEEFRAVNLLSLFRLLTLRPGGGDVGAEFR